MNERRKHRVKRDVPGPVGRARRRTVTPAPEERHEAPPPPPSGPSASRRPAPKVRPPDDAAPAG